MFGFLVASALAVTAPQITSHPQEAGDPPIVEVNVELLFVTKAFLTRLEKDVLPNLTAERVHVGQESEGINPGLVRYLSEEERFRLLDAAQKDPKSNVFSFPLTRALNGESVTHSAMSSHDFVDALAVPVGEDGVKIVPNSVSVKTGLELSMVSTVDPNQAEIGLRVRCTKQHIRDVETLEIYAGAGRTLKIQRPTLDTHAVGGRLAVPEDRIALFYPFAMSRNANVGAEPPMLGKLPLLKQLFKHNAHDHVHVLLLFRPRVVGSE